MYTLYLWLRRRVTPKTSQPLQDPSGDDFMYPVPSALDILDSDVLDGGDELDEPTPHARDDTYFSDSQLFWIGLSELFVAFASVFLAIRFAQGITRAFILIAGVTVVTSIAIFTASRVPAPVSYGSEHS